MICPFILLCCISNKHLPRRRGLSTAVLFWLCPYPPVHRESHPTFQMPLLLLASIPVWEPPRQLLIDSARSCWEMPYQFYQLATRTSIFKLNTCAYTIDKILIWTADTFAKLRQYLLYNSWKIRSQSNYAFIHSQRFHSLIWNFWNDELRSNGIGAIECCQRWRWAWESSFVADRGSCEELMGLINWDNGSKPSLGLET